MAWTAACSGLRWGELTARTVAQVDPAVRVIAVDRKVVEVAGHLYLRDENGDGRWTWHSLRQVFCTTALFTWKLDATDVSRMAGHANYRITTCTLRRCVPHPSR